MWFQWSWLRTWPSNGIFRWPRWIFRFRNITAEGRLSTVESISQLVNLFVGCRDTSDNVNKLLVSRSVIQLLFIQWLSLPVWVSEWVSRSVSCSIHLELWLLHCRCLQSLLSSRQVWQYQPKAATHCTRMCLGRAHAMFGRWAAGVHAPRVVGEADASKLWPAEILIWGVLCPGDTAHWWPSLPQGWSAATSSGVKLSSE
jgi:hypothetical protein